MQFTSFCTEKIGAQLASDGRKTPQQLLSSQACELDRPFSDEDSGEKWGICGGGGFFVFFLENFEVLDSVYIWEIYCHCW